eukprot:XP_001697919.1 cytochrome P450 [Chlamydomonas reinhardtii]
MHTAPRRIHAARCRPLHASTGASTPGPAGAPDLPPLQRAPGPPGLPWLGQLPAYLATKFFPKKMLEWSEQYNGVYAMEIVGRKYLVVTEPSLIAGIVGRGSAGLPKSTGYAMWDSAISPHAGVQGLFTVAENTTTWRAVRRAYGPAIGPGSMSGTSTSTSSSSTASINSTTGLTSHEMNHLAKCLTLDMLGLSAFGIDFRCLDDPAAAQLPSLIESAMHECGERARSVGRRLLPWLYEEEARAGAADMAAFHALVEDVWRQIRARGAPTEDDNSFGAQLLRLADPSLAPGGAALSDEQICAEIATVIIAGYETTANTLTWMLYGLHAHKDASEQLVAELRGAGLVPDTSSSSSPSSVDPTTASFASLAGAHEALGGLPVLDAYVRECLRLYSTAPNGLIKEVPKNGPPARVGPFAADPGVVVWIPFWSLHLSNLNWEQPHDFQLSRWLGKDPRTAGSLTASRCPLSLAYLAARFDLVLDEARMGGSAAAALERQRVNLTLEVDGGMYLLGASVHSHARVYWYQLVSCEPKC